MAKRVRSIKEAPDPTRPLAESTTFEHGPKGGKFLYIIAKVQAGLPLSALDRDITLRVLRKQWLTTKEHAAFLRAAELRQIDVAKELLERAEKANDSDEWLCGVTGRKTIEAVKQFEKRERKHRR
jgi:hypothetical protein